MNYWKNFWESSSRQTVNKHFFRRIISSLIIKLTAKEEEIAETVEGSYEDH